MICQEISIIQHINNQSNFVTGLEFVSHVGPSCQRHSNPPLEPAAYMCCSHVSVLSLACVGKWLAVVADAVSWLVKGSLAVRLAGKGLVVCVFVNGWLET